MTITVRSKASASLNLRVSESPPQTAGSHALFAPQWQEASLAEIATRAPLQPLAWSRVTRRGIHLSIKREDTLDIRLGGNKFYKLHGHLKHLHSLDSTLPAASFGGAWSNHLYALAAACEQLDLPCTGIVRGEKPSVFSPTLADVERMGMRLVFISRQDYRRRHDPALLRELETRIGPCHWVPEGGGGIVGARGCRAIAEGILALAPQPPDVICHAVGTGASLAGIASALKPGMRAMGIVVLKGADYLERDIHALVNELGGTSGKWQLNYHYHCGGYARAPDYLLEFIKEFEAETGILLDPVYTAKLMWAITCLAESGYWPAGTHVVAVHSGGLQGRRGYNLGPRQHEC